MRKHNNKKEITYSILLLVIPMLILFSTFLLTRKTPAKEVLVEEPKSKVVSDVFNDINLIAKSAVVKDLNTGKILYSKNADTTLPLASITKILTVLTFDKLFDEETAQIKLQDLLTEGNSNLIVGESFDTKDLIDLTLTVSSNDGATALASNVINSFSSYQEIDFIEEMNKLAKKIGMNQSVFYNETGLDINESKAGAYGSASDVAKLFEYALKNRKDLFDATTKSNLTVESQEGLIHNAQNTNKIVNDLPNILVGKTGYTDIAGGNLAVAIDPSLNRPVLIIVLGSTIDGRFEDINLLAEKTIEYFKNNY